MPSTRTQTASRSTPARRRRGGPVRGATVTGRAASVKSRTKKLPGWGELTTKNERAPGKPRGSGFLETVSTLRFALFILAVAAAFTLYVGHVHATQGLLAEVQELRRENLRLHLKHNRLKGDFDRVTSPAVIYERARALGLEQDITYGPVITVRE